MQIKFNLRKNRSLHAIRLNARLRQQLKISYKKILTNGIKTILYQTLESIMISSQHMEMQQQQNNTAVVRMLDVVNLGRQLPKKILYQHAIQQNVKQEQPLQKLLNLFGNTAAATKPPLTALWPKKCLTQSAPQSTATKKTQNPRAEIMTDTTMLDFNLMN